MHDHNEQIIQQLLKLWYNLIGADHHKDRDCWFFIEREYCTYKDPSWIVRHHGYIRRDYQETFTTFEKAQEGLIEFLIDGCAKEINTIRDNSEYDKERGEEYCNNKLKELEKIVIELHYIID
jgi:hypothetical protein